MEFYLRSEPMVGDMVLQYEAQEAIDVLGADAVDSMRRGDVVWISGALYCDMKVAALARIETEIMEA